MSVSLTFWFDCLGAGTKTRFPVVSCLPLDACHQDCSGPLLCTADGGACEASGECLAAAATTDRDAALTPPDAAEAAGPHRMLQSGARALKPRTCMP